MKNLKNKIKELGETQKGLKNQRKDVKIVGERTMPTWEACWKHAGNRDNLRLLFAAYGLMRGKPFSVTENTHSEENHPLKCYQVQIDKIIEQYAEIVCVSEP
jgi:hypothetical protein